MNQKLDYSPVLEGLVEGTEDTAEALRGRRTLTRPPPRFPFSQDMLATTPDPRQNSLHTLDSLAFPDGLLHLHPNSLFRQRIACSLITISH
jgi:hypothetical protein